MLDIVGFAKYQKRIEELREEVFGLPVAIFWDERRFVTATFIMTLAGSRSAHPRVVCEDKISALDAIGSFTMPALLIMSGQLLMSMQVSLIKEILIKFKGV
jgi:hypothetical protein